MSGAPELLSEEAELVTDAGARIRLRPNLPLRVFSFDGASRRQLEVVTKAGGGVEERFSFEVPASAPFEIEGRLEGGASAHPWRSGAVTLEPSGAGYLVNPPEETKFDASGCLAYPLALAGMIGVFWLEAPGWRTAAGVVNALALFVLAVTAFAAAGERDALLRLAQLRGRPASPGATPAPEPAPVGRVDVAAVERDAGEAEAEAAEEARRADRRG